MMGRGFSFTDSIHSRTRRSLAPSMQFMPFFSPDGLWVGFTDLRLDGSNSLKRVSLSGDPTQTIVVHSSLGFGTVWAEDGSIIFADLYGLKRVAGHRREGRGDTEAGRGAAGSSHRFPEVLPGFRTVLFTCIYRSSDGIGSRIEALSLESGERHIIVNDASMLHFVPDLNLLLFRRQGSLLAASFDPATLASRCRSAGPDARSDFRDDDERPVRDIRRRHARVHLVPRPGQLERAGLVLS